jgi:FkbM family methyltransferase
MTLRAWAEYASRGIILRRHLPRAFGGLPIFVSPEAGLRYWRRDLAKVDPMLLRMARELVKPGHVIWDVGANLGLFTFAAAALAGPSGYVIAIEPDLWLAQLLQRSAEHIRTRAVARVNVLSAAVSDSIRVAHLSIAGRSRAANHLVESVGSTQSGGHRALQSTLAVSLDFLLEHFPHPSVLKIDVEGAEVSVLKGAARLLRTVRPVIWCEVDPDNSLPVAQQFLESGYQIFAAALDPDKRQPLKRASWDTLAIPLPLAESGNASS